MNDGLVWITGAGGLIGSYLARISSQEAAGRRVTPLTRQDLDFIDYAAVRLRFAREKPSLVIHCAALSRSPECQTNPAKARQQNVEVTTNLAEVAADIPFVFFSTDLVFDGKKGHYDETSPVNPLSVYAQTKVAAEQIVLSNPKHTVIRTSLNGGKSPAGDRGFNEQLRHAWEAGKTMALFTDEFRCPIAAALTAQTVWRLVMADSPGLYHLAGGERMSRFQIGELLAARYRNLNPRFVPGSAADYPGAPRSPDTSLNCSKIENLLSLRLPGLKEWLAANPHQEF
jgi:dTDP-4-dehydrorhamnose reductase